MPIGKPLTYTELRAADKNFWCTTDDLFVPIHTPTLRCLRQFETFCKTQDICDYGAREISGTSTKNGFKNSCWKDHILGTNKVSFISRHKGALSCIY